MRRTAPNIRFAAALLMAAAAWQCGGPTGKDDDPQLKVEPQLLDFGTERTSLSFTIENTGSGILNFHIQIPSEGWITVSQTDGTVVNTPLSVDVRIDREKAPVGDQEVKLVITALRVRLEVTVRASILQPGELTVSTAALEFGETTNQQQLTVSNAGGQTLEWQATPAQSWIEVAPASGRLAPGDEQIVTLTVDRSDQPAGAIQGSVDFSSEAGSRSVSVEATVVNRPPVLAPVEDQQVWEGETLSFELVASDADGDALSYGVESQPGGSTLVERLFQWTPVRGEAGTYEVTFTVNDGNGGTDRETVTITVEKTNQAPVLAPIGDQQVEEGATLTVELVASDADGDELSFQVEGQPDGASLAGDTFTWAPTREQAGTYHVTFKVNDGQGGTDRETIAITVGRDNIPPVLTEIYRHLGDEWGILPMRAGADPVLGIDPLFGSVTIGSKWEGERILTITLEATDADGDELQYGVTANPAGSSLSGDTFRWEPTEEQEGTYQITFTVSDGQGGTDSETITITVTVAAQARGTELFGKLVLVMQEAFVKLAVGGGTIEGEVGGTITVADNKMTFEDFSQGGQLVLNGEMGFDGAVEPPTLKGDLVATGEAYEAPVDIKVDMTVDLAADPPYGGTVTVGGVEYDVADLMVALAEGPGEKGETGDVEIIGEIED